MDAVNGATDAVVSVDLAHEGLRRLTVAVPDSWTVTSAAGPSRVVFAGVDSHLGSGFLPNVAMRIDPDEEPDDLPTGNLVLSDRLVERDDQERRVRMLLSVMADEMIVQQVTTLTSDGTTATVVASATQDQWPSLAADFDAVSSSATLGAPAS